jgi:hypothetical protein
MKKKLLHDCRDRRLLVVITKKCETLTMVCFYHGSDVVATVDLFTGLCTATPPDFQGRNLSQCRPATRSDSVGLI